MPPTLVFLPGLGSGPRLFKRQMTAFPNSLAIDWIDPKIGESLEQYAVRIAEMIRTELEQRPPAPVLVCGFSLGGMVAPYVARHLDAVGCVLLCSVRCPREFPWRFYPNWLFSRFCPSLRLMGLSLTQLGARFLLLFPGLPQGIVSSRALKQVIALPTRRKADLAAMMFDWAFRRRPLNDGETPLFSQPILQVHGTRDPLLPIRVTTPDIRIEGGGHLLPLTHPEEMNAILRDFVNSFSSPEQSDSRPVSLSAENWL